MNKQTQWYQLQRSAAVIIQVKFRATILMRSERENFLKMKSAAITIQNKFRDRMLGQKERRYFLEKKSAVFVIQQWFRACLRKKEREHFTLLNLQQKEHRKRTAAAIKIQVCM
jgi:abnormal spindle-like microcephaly-associated protein